MKIMNVDCRAECGKLRKIEARPDKGTKVRVAATIVCIAASGIKLAEIDWCRMSHSAYNIANTKFMHMEAGISTVRCSAFCDWSATIKCKLYTATDTKRHFLCLLNWAGTAENNLSTAEYSCSDGMSFFCFPLLNTPSHDYSVKFDRTEFGVNTLLCNPAVTLWREKHFA